MCKLESNKCVPRASGYEIIEYAEQPRYFEERVMGKIHSHNQKHSCLGSSPSVQS